MLLLSAAGFSGLSAADGEYYEAEISDGTVADVLARAQRRDALGPTITPHPSLDSPVTEAWAVCAYTV